MELDSFIIMLKNNWQYFLLGLILLVHTFVLTKLFFFPYPELFIYPYLTNHGLKPYSQILDQHFPGLLFLPVNFDNLGMTNPGVARIWLMVTVALTQILLFFISKKIFKSGKKALLVNFLYLIWQPFFEGWVLWIDSFLPVILLPSFYGLLKKRFLGVGLLLGVGIVFKQTIIPLSILILIYILASEKNFKTAAKYLCGLTLPVILMVSYLFSKGSLADFWYWTVIFNLTVYASSGTQIPNSFGFIIRVLFVYAVSLSGFLNKDRRLIIILSLFLIGSLAGVFDRANFVHFQPSLPFAILGTTLGLYSLTKKSTIMILLGLYLGVTVWWQNIFYKGHISEKVFFFDQPTYAVAKKMRKLTKPGDKIFVFGAVPLLYQMSNTLPAGDIFVFQFPWFLKVAGTRVLDGIMADKPRLVVADRTVKIEDQKITDFAREIDQYILQNYEPIDQVGTTFILRRKAP